MLDMVVCEHCGGARATSGDLTHIDVPNTLDLARYLVSRLLIRKSFLNHYYNKTR